MRSSRRHASSRGTHAASSTSPSGSSTKSSPSHPATSNVNTVANQPSRRSSTWAVKTTGPGSSTVIPVSSLTSRITASCANSPGSTRPPGIDQNGSSPGPACMIMRSSPPKRTIAVAISSCSGSNVCVAEHALDLVVQRALVVEQAARCLARAFQQRSICAKPREGEVGEAGLPRPEQLPLAADLQIGLGELEAVIRTDERLETCERGIGQLLLRPRDEQAVGLLRPAAHAPAQLVELGQA